jgi:signal peptidase I
MSVQTGTKRKEGGFAETVRVIIHALIIALVIRTFLFQPFNIPSGSMIPTLLVGDYLFVSKYSYGYTHYSLPFSPPIFSGRVIGQSVAATSWCSACRKTTLPITSSASSGCRAIASR